MSEDMVHQGLQRLMEELKKVAAGLQGDIQIQYGDKRLYWDKSKKQFSFEASDFQWGPSQTVSITNPKTGGVALYKHPRLHKDHLGEQEYWDLDGPYGTSLRIWND